MSVKLGFFSNCKLVLCIILCVTTPFRSQHISDEDVDYDLYIDYNPHDQIAMEVTSRPLGGNLNYNISDQISSANI